MRQALLRRLEEGPRAHRFKLSARSSRKLVALRLRPVNHGARVHGTGCARGASGRHLSFKACALRTLLVRSNASTQAQLCYGCPHKVMEQGQEFSLEYALLEAGCSYAAAKLGKSAVLSLLNDFGIVRETIGRVTSKTADCVLCSSSLGQVAVPAHAFADAKDLDRAGIGSSWILTTLPLQSPGSAWRATRAVLNKEGWECPRTTRTRRGPTGSGHR